MWFTRVSIDNPVFATMMMVALLVLGIFSYQRLPVDEFPDIKLPIVAVITEYPGGSPEIVVSDVSRPIEEAINTVAGISHISSESYEGLSVVIAQFQLSVDPVNAAQDVREKVASIRAHLRKGVKEPTVERFDPKTFPVASISVRSAQRSLLELTMLTNRIIKRRFENMRGVGAVNVVGGTNREINIFLKPEAMYALGVGVNQIINIVAAENQELPAGAITAHDNETMVRVTGRIADATDFAKLVIGQRGSVPIYLSQVANIVDGPQEDESMALINGERAISLNLIKLQSANTIAVVDDAHVVIQTLARELPKDVQLDLIRDTSLPIRSAITHVKSTLLEGAVLTIAIVFLFLASWRSTVITGLTLPISLMGTFILMPPLGFSINLLTLMGLSLCVGLLIDDAIVVRENIVRHLAMGKNHRTAALEGTEEIGLAVLATTLSIVAVFLPVGFMGGIIGKFFHQFGITVAFAVLLSMFVSFTLDPMLSSIWPDPQAHGQFSNTYMGRLLRGFDVGQTRLAGRYQKLLSWSLVYRKTTLIIALLSFLASFLLLPLVGTEFISPEDKGEVLVQFNTPPGSSLALTQSKAIQVEQVMRTFPELEYTYATINTGELQGKNYVSIFGKLKARSERTRLLQAFEPELRARLVQVAGIEIIWVGEYASVGSGKPIQISVQGANLDVLQPLAKQVMQAMAKVPDVVDLENSFQAGKPTIAIDVKRDLAADLGLGVGAVGDALRPLFSGDPVTTWKGEDGENYDVRVRLSPQARAQTADLHRLALTSSDGSGRMIKLDQIAHFRETIGPTQINRKDLNYEILVSANVSGRAAGDVGKEVDRALKKIPFPPGYHFDTAGANNDMAETMTYAVQALVLAVIFIYLILASQFKSFFQPIAIMVSLPLSLVGVLLALLVARSTLNIFSVIGFIMLMGLVTKNAILLIDFINQSRQAGQTRTQAILEAAHVRLRPILMTTLAMIFGMLPLAFSPLMPNLSDGAEVRAPMAQAVIGGIITSSLLTLVVVPVVYTYLDDFSTWLYKKWSQK